MPKYTAADMNLLKGRKTQRSSISGRRQVKDLSYLSKDIKNAVQNMGYGMAEEIGRTVMEDTRPDLEWSGRLRASGFLFINGDFVDESGGPINMGSSRKHGSGGYGPIKPDAPFLTVTGKSNQFQIDVIWHTPKKVNKGKVFYIWKGRKWFDYALFKLEKTRFMSIYTESIKNVQKKVKQLADKAFYEALT